MGEIFMPKFYPRLGKRKETFKYIFQHLQSELIRKRKISILETGMIRQKDNWLGDGQSTIMFREFANYYDNVHLISIDIDPKAIEFAKKELNINDEINENTMLVCGDSVNVLYSLTDSLYHSDDIIDLLYLDSYDIDWKNPMPSALHHMKELVIIFDYVSIGGMIVIDDNKNGIGKGMFIKDFFNSLKVKPVFDEYQMGFIVEPPTFVFE